MRNASPVLAVLLLLAACSLTPPPAPPQEPALPPADSVVAPVEETVSAGVCEPPPHEATDARVEVLWDTWGVPHIFAQDLLLMFHAFGWAQMRSHGDLLLRLYGESRGRAAEYWGPAHLASDRWLVTNGVPERAQEWLAAMAPHMRVYLESFAEGINTYARDHAQCIDDAVEVVLPVTAADVLMHVQRVIHFTFIADAGTVPDARGSNAWAVAPARSASGNALLLANPHLPWDGIFTWYEAQLSGPGMDAYGAALLGFPLPGIAFNDHLGWTHTVNTLDAADLYELTPAGQGYAWDGAERAYDVATRTLRVRQQDGSVAEQTIEVRRSVHGPIVAERDGRPLALRVAGLDRPHLMEQTWEMLRAQDRGGFESALARQQIPLFTVMYADTAGHILHAFNGAVPVRASGGWEEWAGTVRGDTSATLWTDTHPYIALPRVLDPSTGWLQNANDPPWTTTFPSPVEPGAFPANIAPRRPLSFRAQRSARLLAEDASITFDEFVAYKHDTRAEAADHVLEDVLHAARVHGDERARRAAAVLAQWDRETDADSRGAILFQAFMRELMRRPWSGGSPFDVPWLASAPFTTPDGLADPLAAAHVLSEAAAAVEERFGALDAAWGDVHRLRRDSLDLPANGGPGAIGVFRVTDFAPDEDGLLRAVGGDSFIAAIEFSSPVRAMALLPYGNASQPGSPHRTDQLALYAQKRLRAVWRIRAEVEANLTRIDRF